MEDCPPEKYTLIFIRHGEKEYNNLKGPASLPLCDPELKNNSKTSIIKKSENLRRIYGDPSAIFTSPYVRTRQTSELLSMGKTEVIPLQSMSEYLGYLDHLEIKYDFLDKTTLSFGKIPGIYEKYKSFKKRVKNLTKGLSKRNPYIIIGSNKVNIKPGTYWFVTHGHVMYNIQCSYITFKHKVDLKKRIPYLGCFAVKDTALIYDF